MTDMTIALRSEYRKFVTTRMWWILLVSMTGYMMFIGAVMAFTITASADTGTAGETAIQATPENIRTTVYGSAAAFGYVFPAIIGLLSVTGEFRHKTITPTILANPRRGRVLLAKMISSLPIGFIYGTVATLGTVLAGATVLAVTDNPTYLDGDTWALVARSVLALTIWAAVGVGLGSLITNQVFAVIVVLVYTQFLEALLRLGLTALGDAGEKVAAYLPGAAGEAITGGSFYSAAGIAEMLPWGVGVAVLAGYAAVFAIVGTFTTLRKDIA